MTKTALAQQTKIAGLLPSSQEGQHKCACEGSGARCAPLTGRTITGSHFNTPSTAGFNSSIIAPTEISAPGGIPVNLRKDLERTLGHDFSNVRLHADNHAARFTTSLGAKAVTTGEDIFFAPMFSDFGLRENRALLAHELTHVVQQRNGRVGMSESATTALSSASSLETEAERAADKVRSGEQQSIIMGRAPNSPQRAELEILKTLRAFAAGGLNAVADLVVSIDGSTSGLLGEIDQLRKQFIIRTSPLILPPPLVQKMAEIYEDLRSVAPSWLPLPVFQFAPNFQPAALFIVGGVAVAVEALILFCAFVLVMLFLLGNLDPKTRKNRERAVEDVINRLRELTKPKPVSPPPEDKKPEESKPEQKPEPKQVPKPKTGPESTKDPPPIPKFKPKDDKERIYPIFWATQLGPPTRTMFQRVKVEERDLNEQKQQRLEINMRKIREPDLPGPLHVHHVVPLFLGGVDDLHTNGTWLRASLHMKGHSVLNHQPQIPKINPVLEPYLTRHPVGTRYKLVGYKDSKDENESDEN